MVPIFCASTNLWTVLVMCTIQILASATYQNSTSNTMITVPSTIFVEQENLIHIWTDISHPHVFILATTARIPEFSYLITNEVSAPIDSVGYELNVSFPAPFMVSPQLPIGIRMKITIESTNPDKASDQYTAYFNVTVRQKPIILLKETDKLLYRPGDTVKARLFPLTPSLIVPQASTVTYPARKVIQNNQGKLVVVNTSQWEMNTLEQPVFDQIYIEDPLGNRMKKWRNITTLMASLLSYTLSTDAQEGSWLIVASVGRQTERLIFEVRNYQSPPFIIQIEPPVNLTSWSSHTQFKVCATRTNGLPLSGTVRPLLCVCSQPARAYEAQTTKIITRERKCPKQSWIAARRPCVYVTETVLDPHTGCSTFNVTTAALDLHNLSYPTGSQKVILCAQVEQNNAIRTTEAHCEFEHKIDFQLPRLELKMPHVFKRGLPIHGVIQLHDPRVTDLSNVTVQLKLRQIRIPCNSYNVSHEEIPTYQQRIIMVLQPNGTKQFTLPPIESSMPIAVYAKCLTNAKGQSIETNGNSSQAFSQAKITMAYWHLLPWTTTSSTVMQLWPTEQPIAVKCPGLVHVQLIATVPLQNKTFYLQTVTRGKFKQLVIKPTWEPDLCLDRDDDLGHYACLDLYHDKIQCLTGWMGDGCLQPESSASHNFSRNSTNIHHQVHQSHVRIHERSIRFAIDGSYGPESVIVLFFHHSTVDQNRIVPVTFKLTNLKNCSSQAMSMESTMNYTGLYFNRSFAIPGDKVTLFIQPKNIMDMRNVTHSKPELCFVRIAEAVPNRTTLLTDSRAASMYENILQQVYNDPRPTYPTTVAQAFQAAGLSVHIANEEQTGDKGSLLMCVSFRTFGPEYPDLFKYKPTLSVSNSFYTDDRMFSLNVWRFDVVPISVLQLTNVDQHPVYGVYAQLSLPQLVTTWEASAFCTTTSSGLWIGKPTLITVTLPFFIELTLPKQIKRGEILLLPISVFARDNSIQMFEWNNTCFQIQLKIQADSNQWQLIGRTEQAFCICHGKKNTFTQAMSAQQLGLLNVTVEANATAGSEECGSSGNAPRRFADQVQRQILVSPEGTPQHASVGDIFCLSPNGTSELLTGERTFPISLPDNLVPGSLRIYLDYSDQVLGPALNNLNQLIRIPTGCGEQNMLLSASNVYLLDYYLTVSKLKFASQSNRMIQLAKENIVKGYRNQLMFQLNDGSFSAFGSADQTGSTWLTAYVLRVFATAFRIDNSLEIDWTTLFLDTSRFLGEQQNKSDGCFYEPGRTIHSAVQGVIGSSSADEQTVFITAHVISSLLKLRETKSSLNDAQVKYRIEGALGCLARKLKAIDGGAAGLTTYTLAQVSYVVSLTRVNLTTSLVKQLKSSQHNSSSGTFFKATDAKQPESRKASSSLDIETTAYAYLTFADQKSDHRELFQIIRWLVSRQTTRGGFYATQDTVLGVQAIVSYAKLTTCCTTTGALSIVQIQANIEPGNYSFKKEFTPDKRLFSIPVTVAYIEPENVRHIRWTVSVSPPAPICLAVHASLLFTSQIQLIAADQAFMLDTSVSPPSSSSINTCNRANLTVCLRPPSDLSRPVETGLLLVQVSMVSGWQPVRDQIIGLVGSQIDSVRQVEFDEQKDMISLYFNGLSLSELPTVGQWTNVRRCAVMSLEQQVYVKDARPALVEARDYYASERTVSANYTLKSYG